MSNARPVGCARRRLAILVHGGNRRSLVAGIGMPMPCAISCAAMSSSIWQMTMRSSSSTRPAFSSRAASCGVARQYTGSAGKITNCQIGVFAAYVSRHGHAFIDRALYLPKEWTDDPDRLEAAYVPPDVGFATKPQLATRMIAHAIAVSVPFKWVAGDTVYGVGDIEQQLRRAGKGYVLGVSSAHVFQSWGKRRSVAGKAADIAQTRRASDWKRLSAGAGTKGPRLHDWCYLELADLEVEQLDDANPGLWTRGLLIRRHIADGDLAFFTTWCPAATSIETLVTVAAV